MARNIVIADQHEEYVNRLVSFIQKKYGDKYEIERFDEKSKLKARIEEKECEVLLLSPELYDASLYFKNVKLPVIMAENEEALVYPEKLKWRINKYTRITTLMSYLEKEYEEVERNRPVIYGVYAPAGGVGKSTVAVAAALTYARAGKKVLYLNMEDVDSTNMFFDEEPADNENFAGIKENDQYGTFLKENIKQDPLSKVMFIKRDLLSIHSMLQGSLPTILERIIDDNVANIIVVDFNSNYGQFTPAVLQSLDYMMLITNAHTHATYKLKNWLSATHMAEKLKDKLKLVINQGKEFDSPVPMDVIGRIDKLYATSPLGLCEYIAQNQFLSLHGLV